MMPMPMESHNKKSHVAPLFNCRDLMNAMIPLMIPLASCDVSANDSTYHFDCLDLRNAMVPFTMPFATCDANASTSGVT